MYMSSQCTNDGTYTLTVTFRLGMDTDMAQVLVQNRVSLALPVIPPLVQNEGITVKKMSPNTMMIVNLISPDGQYDSTFLSNYATIYIKDELGRVAGRRRDHLPGPARLQPAGLARPRQDGGAEHQRRGCRDGDQPAEPPGCRRPDRPAAGPPRPAIPAHDQHPGPAGGAGAVRRHHHQGRPGRHADGGRAGRVGRRRAGRFGRRAGRVRQRPGRHRRLELPGGGDRPGRLEQPGPTDVAGHRHRPASRRGTRRAGIAAVRPVVHPRRQAVRGHLHLPVARLQCAGDGRRRLRQDEGAQGPLPGRAGLPDRLRHDAVHPRVGQRGLQHPPRRGDPGGHRRAGLPPGLEGDDPADDRRPRLLDRHVRDHGRAGLQPEQPDAVRPGAGDRDRGRRRHRGAGEHRAADRDRPGLADGDDQGDGGDHRADPGDHAGAERGVHPVLLPGRDHGPVLPAVRGDDRGVDDHLGDQRADDDAVAGRDDLPDGGRGPRRPRAEAGGAAVVVLRRGGRDDRGLAGP